MRGNTFSGRRCAPIIAKKVVEIAQKERPTPFAMATAKAMTRFALN